MKKRTGYRKHKKYKGIYQNITTKRYRVNIKVKGEPRNMTFDLLEDALLWRNECMGNTELYLEKLAKKDKCYSTLREVYYSMQVNHFDTLAPSTRQIWNRRYELLKSIEHLTMNKITPSLVTSWINIEVKKFKEDHYIKSRGHASRCNLYNEINLLKTIFNWYKRSIEFEHEAINLTCPVHKDHKKKAIIKPLPIKSFDIPLEDILTFFDTLPELYSDLSKLQFYTASRIGEVAGLQWNRIDLEKNTMTIMETCQWDMSTKTYVKLNPTPKNKLPRVVHITDEIRAILERRETYKIKGNQFVFHFERKPLNYGTILVNYRTAQRKSKLRCTGTHFLRHAMAKLARRVGGGLDAVIAMTGHKDIKLADHYSKLSSDFQRKVSTDIMDHIKAETFKIEQSKNKVIVIKSTQVKLPNNVISLNDYRAALSFLR